jgi:flagellar biosynthesis/type III secretory pathway M-ring protein FliF/YscJ
MGYDEVRGDQLEVAFMPFVRPAHVKEKPVEPIKIMGQEPQTWGVIGVGVAALLFAGWIIFSIRRKRRLEAEEAARLAALYGEDEESFPPEPSMGEKVEDQRRRAADVTRHDVLPTANVIRGWLEPNMDLA